MEPQVIRQRGVHRSDRTAAAILDAAAHVLSEQGSSASMADVAEEPASAVPPSIATTPSGSVARRAGLPTRLPTPPPASPTPASNAPRSKRRSSESCAPWLQSATVTPSSSKSTSSSTQAEAERLLGAPMRAVFARGIESGLFRQDLSVDVLLELFGGALMAAVKLTQRRQLGLEEASAATAAVFLDGARAR